MKVKLEITGETAGITSVNTLISDVSNLFKNIQHIKVTQVQE